MRVLHHVRSSTGNCVAIWPFERVYVVRVVVGIKRKRVVRVQPAMIGMAALVAVAN